MIPMPELLASAQSDGAALASSTTQTSILPSHARQVVAASGPLLRVGFQMLVMASGRISTVVTTPGTLTFDLKLGSVVIGTSGALSLNTTAQTNVNWFLFWLFTLRAVGSGTSANFMHQGYWESHAVIGSPAPTAGGAGKHMLPYNAAAAVGTGFDSTAAAILDLFATWSVSNASNSITLHQYSALYLNP